MDIVADEIWSISAIVGVANGTIGWSIGDLESNY